jgi:hypothetical protein
VRPISLLDAGTSRAHSPIVPSLLFHSEAILPQYHLYKSAIELAAQDPSPWPRRNMRNMIFVNLREEISIRQLLEQIRSLLGLEGAIRSDATNPAAGRAAATILRCARCKLETSASTHVSTLPLPC